MVPRTQILSDEELHLVFTRFKELCDKKKHVVDEDLEVIVTEGILRTSELFKLDYLHVAAGTTVIGIGIGDHTVDLAYQRHEVVEQPDQLAKAMIDGTSSALRRSLAISGMDSWWLRAVDFHEKEKSIA